MDSWSPNFLIKYCQIFILQNFVMMVLSVYYKVYLLQHIIYLLFLK